MCVHQWWRMRWKRRKERKLNKSNFHSLKTFPAPRKSQKTPCLLLEGGTSGGAWYNEEKKTKKRKKNSKWSFLIKSDLWAISLTYNGGFGKNVQHYNYNEVDLRSFHKSPLVLPRSLKEKREKNIKLVFI